MECLAGALEERDAEVQLRFVRFLREELEDEERAFNVLRESLGTWPDDAGLLEPDGRVLRDVRENYDGAEAYFSRALEFAPEDPRLLVDAANLARSHGRDITRAGRCSTAARWWSRRTGACRRCCWACCSPTTRRTSGGRGAVSRSARA